VVFTAPEEEVQRINDALAAGVVPVEAWSSDGKTLLSRGHLALVNNAVDQASGDIRPGRSVFCQVWPTAEWRVSD
jgi:membrane fusion protein, multidrug efflux system